MTNRRFFNLALASIAGIAIPIAACAEIYPGPGVSLYVPSCSGIEAFPESSMGTVLLDVGLIKAERASMYGIGFALATSFYNVRMVGLQTALLAAGADNAYGAQMGFVNIASKNGYVIQIGAFNGADKGFGLQAGLLNDSNDESFRLQVAGFFVQHSKHP